MAQSIISYLFSSTSNTKIPSGELNITSNTSFAVPYNGIYTVVLNAPTPPGGNGANGNSSSYAGAGGGAGGSAYRLASPLIGLLDLKANTEIQCTCGRSLVSFGNLLSIASGSMGRDGSYGGDDENNYGGAGGAGGSKPILSYSSDAPEIINIYQPIIPDYDLSGGDGSPIKIERYSSYNIYIGGDGGRPSSNFGNSGGAGGRGKSCISTYTIANATNGQIPSNELMGSIQIIWGN